MVQHCANEPWEVLPAIRTEIYDDMVADPQVIRDNQWPHTIGLLRVAHETFCRTALATMSYRQEALHVLRSLNIEETLDEVLTREDVENPKPDPEIYSLAAQKLARIPHLAQTSDAVNRQLSCFSSRYMHLLAVFQI